MFLSGIQRFMHTHIVFREILLNFINQGVEVILPVAKIETKTRRLYTLLYKKNQKQVEDQQPTSQLNKLTTKHFFSSNKGIPSPSKWQILLTQICHIYLREIIFPSSFSSLPPCVSHGFEEATTLPLGRPKSHSTKIRPRSILQYRQIFELVTQIFT